MGVCFSLLGSTLRADEGRGTAEVADSDMVGGLEGRQYIISTAIRTKITADSKSSRVSSCST